MKPEEIYFYVNYKCIKSYEHRYQPFVQWYFNVHDQNFQNSEILFDENEHEVCQIMVYSFVERYKYKFNLEDTYFVKGSSSLGWATWKNSWRSLNIDSHELIAFIEKNNLQKSFDRNNSYNYMKMLKQQAEGKIDSWAIRWYASAFINNLYNH